MIQNGTRQLTAFETVLGAILDDGHSVTFKESKGTISVILDDGDQIVLSCVNFEQIGQLFIESAVSAAFKESDQGGAGDTRIDGGDELVECDGCGDEVPVEEIKKIYRGKNSGKVSCQECYLDMEDR